MLNTDPPNVKLLGSEQYLPGHDDYGVRTYLAKKYDGAHTYFKKTFDGAEIFISKKKVGRRLFL